MEFTRTSNQPLDLAEVKRLAPSAQENLMPLLNRFRPAKKPRTRAAMIAYLGGHYRYHTMNSWNQSTSYAHNLKMHHLEFPSKEIQDRAWDIIGCEDADGAFYGTNQLIGEFTDTEGGSYTAGFNGRSGGYLVMYHSQRKPSQYTHRCTGCGHRAYGAEAAGHNYPGCTGKHEPFAFPQELVTWPGKNIDQGEDFAEWETYTLKERVDLVWAFDKLAEDCVADFIDFCSTHEVEEVEVTTTRKVSTAVEID